MEASVLSMMIDYVSFVSLGGIFFFGFVFFKIKLNTPFLKLNLKKIRENHSDLSIFGTLIFFIICFSLCAYYRRKVNQTLIVSESPDSKPQKKKTQKPIFKGKNLFWKQEYHRENFEREEKKTLIGSLDDNDNF